MQRRERRASPQSRFRVAGVNELEALCDIDRHVDERQRQRLPSHETIDFAIRLGQALQLRSPREFMRSSQPAACPVG